MKVRPNLIVLTLLAAFAFVPASQALSSRGHRDPVKAYLKHYDKNFNGVIDKDEFPGSSEEFDKWDKNKDGKLETYEIKEMLLHEHHSHKHSTATTTASSN